MRVIALLIAAVVLGLAAYAVSIGRIYLRGGSILGRSESPVLFWVVIAFFMAAGIAALLNGLFSR